MPQFDRSVSGNARRSGLRPASARAAGRPAVRIHQWAEGGRAGLLGQMIVEVSGDVDDESAPDLLCALTRTIVLESRVCCDLRSVGFFGATAADVLAVAHLTAAAARGSFSVRGVRGGTAQVLQTTGLDRILTIVG